MDFEEVKRIVGQLTGMDPVKSGGYWQSRCPCHTDARPSLRLFPAGDEHDGFRVHCLAGCDFKEVKDAIKEGVCAYDPDSLRTDSPMSHKPPWKRPIAATYDYTDETGKVVLQKVRFGDVKDFMIRRPGGPYGWMWGANGTKPPLYNLQKLEAFGAVAVVEGEKDADNLTALGLPATCNIDGASKGRPKWHVEYNEALHDKHVLVLADHDEAGVAHAHTILALLEGVTSKTLVHPLPGLTYKMDVSDWIMLGNTLEDLLALWSRTSGIPVALLRALLDNN